MEDFYETRIDGVDGEIVGLFGVFDGKYTVAFGIFKFQMDQGWWGWRVASRPAQGLPAEIHVLLSALHPGMCHGGARAAEYVKQHLFSNLISHPKFITDTKSAIADAYNHTDSEFLKTDVSQNKDAGTTASTAILVGDRLLVANVGDSRAVICRGGNGKHL
ncbi:putative protein phosphatase 2C 59 [Asimina triloba]